MRDDGTSDAVFADVMDCRVFMVSRVLQREVDADFVLRIKYRIYAPIFIHPCSTVNGYYYNTVLLLLTWKEGLV